MLVKLAELPVDGEDVHVVVLLEVVGEQVQGVITGLKPLLVLVDLLHLKRRTEEFTSGHVGSGRRATIKSLKAFFCFIMFVGLLLISSG